RTSAMTVRASVEVEGGMKAGATKSVSLLAAKEISLEAFPESGVIVPRVPQDVFVVVTHPKPETVVLSQKGAPASDAKTSARGIARVRVVPEDARTVEIEARAEDGATGKIVLTPTLERLVVRTDATQYEPAQPTKLTVLGAEDG